MGRKGMEENRMGWNGRVKDGTEWKGKGWDVMEG